MGLSPEIFTQLFALTLFTLAFMRAPHAKPAGAYATTKTSALRPGKK